MYLNELTRRTDEILVKHLSAELKESLDAFLRCGHSPAQILYVTRQWAPKNGMTDLAIQAYLEGATRHRN